MTRYVLSFLCGLQVAAAANVTDANAPGPVEVVVYSDFQCPFCRQIAQPIRELAIKGVEGIPTKVVFRTFPLSFHPDSKLAAQAAVAAGEQGKFWEMHDLLFANQSALKRDDVLRYAKELKLDFERFQKDLDSDHVKKEVETEQAEGVKRGVNGTPTFYINGKEYSGARSYEQLSKLIQDERWRAVALSEINETMLSRGPAAAGVTLEFFADLESPVSRSAMSVIDEVLQRYPTVVRVQFRNFPLAFHPQAPLAHESAMAAAREGHFWDFAAYILNHQDSLREQDVIAYAGRLGLDETQFASKIREHRYAPRVDADVSEGLKRGVRGSPVIFVNSHRIDGVPSLAKLTGYIEEELAAR